MKHSLLTFALLGSLTLGSVVAQESDPHALDGTELEYTYSDGGSVILTFYDGLLKFLWIAGPNEGAAGEDFEYSARMIGDDRYMVVWRMEEANNFITMVIDLTSRALFTSGLMGYEMDQETVLFDEATIHRVER
ncbi:MAG: hypothetical protein ACR2QQ_04020 [Gammaproteobacteria bacterium]